MMHEHEILDRLKFDIDVPCAVQGGFLWYSGPEKDELGCGE